MLKQSIKDRKGDEDRIPRRFLTLSSWPNSKLYEAGQVDSAKCDFCEDPCQTTHHLVYECPGLSSQRDVASKHVQNIDLRDIPLALQNGLPPALAATGEHTFWGRRWTEVYKPLAKLGCHHCGVTVQTKVKGIMRTFDSELGRRSARQVVTKLRGGFSFDEGFPTPEWVDQPPPGN